MATVSVPARDPYRGQRRKLVLAFDIGTTYSGISYSILDPGQIPQVKGVTRFPSHETISGASKIPTLIYYDRRGNVRAVGAEAMTDGVYETAEDEQWVKAEWLKLHLRSRVGAGSNFKNDIPPLPLNKTVIEVMSDFMRYLLLCSSLYIKDTHANGANLWRSIEGEIDFVLSHPNGWEGAQQTQMRQAAVLAGLIHDSAAGHARLSFVTEGEASLHFAMYNGLPSSAMSQGDGVVIVDAGGGTIDTSFYSKKTTQTSRIIAKSRLPPIVSDGLTLHSRPATTLKTHFVAVLHDLWRRMRAGLPINGTGSHTRLEESSSLNDDPTPSLSEAESEADNVNVEKDSYGEIAAAQCHFHGSVFVNIHARVYLQHYLSGSKYLDDLDDIMRAFDRATKPRFRSDAQPQYIKFGSTRDNDPTYNIRFGQLKMRGSDVALFFQPSIDSIINVVVEQVRVSLKPILHVVLVGGFAASDWLFDSVSSGLAPHGLNVSRPENHVNKAVADGALSFYLDHLVRTRVSKLTYGYFCHIPFNPRSPDHQKRAKKAFISMGGERRINDSFDIILPKNTQVLETKEFKRSYFRESESRSEFDNASFSVWCYRGSLPEPKWKDIDTESYTTLCTIRVDLSHLPLRSQPKSKGRGRYYRLDYDIILLLGLTELRAMVSWKENGSEKRSVARIVYDPDSKGAMNE